MSAGARTTPRAAGRLRSPGALLVIGLCFAGSALARAADPDGVLSGAGGAAAPAPPSAGACPPAEPGGLLAAIRTREAQIAAREAELDERARILEAAEARFRAHEAALRDAEERLSATVAVAEAAAEDDVSRLVAVYESMKPKAAAAIFESMEPGFAAGFLARMNRDAAARVLAGLSPARAYAISAVIAGRNAAAPTE